MNTCDIIIPTYNDSEALSLTLAALSNQPIPSNWEVNVIVVDDGSKEQVETPNTQLPIRVIHQKHAGVAAARNRGIKESSANIILFLGADILLRPGALTKHLTFHEEHPDKKQAALGMIKWDPRLRPTPFMEWMIHGGGQNNFDALLGKNTASPQHFFYGSHVSLKRSVLNNAAFPTIYKQYGWEDLDLGHQLKEKGVKLIVLHKALGLHRHSYTASNIFKRQQTTGKGLTTFMERNQIKDAPTLSRRAHRKLILYSLPLIRNMIQKSTNSLSQSKALPHLFEGVTTAEFWLGSGKVYDK